MQTIQKVDFFISHPFQKVRNVSFINFGVAFYRFRRFNLNIPKAAKASLWRQGPAKPLSLVFKLSTAGSHFYFLFSDNFDELSLNRFKTFIGMKLLIPHQGA